MKYSGTIKAIVIILFLLFIITFISGQTNFSEYTNYNKTIFTEEKIKQFEKDVAEGKNVNINDYVTINVKDYSNKITELGDKICNLIVSAVNSLLKESFKILEKFIN